MRYRGDLTAAEPKSIERFFLMATDQAFGRFF
jgi:hypothetical protein